MSRPSRRWKLIVSNRLMTSTSSAAAAPGAAGLGSSGNCSQAPWPNLLKRVTVPRRRMRYQSRLLTNLRHLVKVNIASPTGASPARRLGEAAPLDPFAEVFAHAFVAHHHLGASHRCSSGAPPLVKGVRGAHHLNKQLRPRPSELRYQALFAPSARPVSQGRPTHLS